MTHLDSLQLRRSHEATRLHNAKSAQERALRTVWLAQIDKEIAFEMVFTANESAMTDDELLAELMA